TPEGGAATNVFEGNAEGSYRDVVVDLSAYANKIVRIELDASEGAGRVLFAEPKVLIPVQQPMQRAEPAKNVVVLLIDTLRADRMKPWNARSRVNTPTIDRLAADGVVFSR